MPKLTIGMAVFQDFDGAAFTLQSLRMHHREILPHVEIIVVDNAPDTDQGRATKNLLGWFGRYSHDVQSVRYVPFTEHEGTSGPRDRVFREAKGDAVLCVDAHVLLPAGSLKRLIAYYDANPYTKDLLSGPILTDAYDVMATHFDDVWRAEMWGTWGRAWRCRCGQTLSVVDNYGLVQFRPLIGEPEPCSQCPMCMGYLPACGWPGHEKVLESNGLKPLGMDVDERPFEIPAMGLGLFSCRRDAWLGFNPKFRGFGGEEFYIHEKYRQAGHKCLCLPFLSWWHRFYREKVPYPLATWWKVRNYVIGHQELGLPLDRLKAHFTNFPPQQWAYAEAAVEWPPDAPENPPAWCPAPEWHAARAQALAPGQPAKAPCLPCGEMSLEKRYELAASQPSDLNEHVPTLKELATGCEVVIDMGTRPGVSTIALLAAQPKQLVSYAPGLNGLVKIAGKTSLVSVRDDTRTASPLPCDLLFLDTEHSADHVYAELDRHAPDCRGRIVLHDTVVFGEKYNGGPGVLPAVRRYLREHQEWTVMRHDRNNNGLMVLTRLASDKKELPPLWQQGWSFFKSMSKMVAGAFGQVQAETAERRLSLCTVCPSRNGEKCGECGCPIEKKVALPDEICPLGSWHAEEVPQEVPA